MANIVERGERFSHLLSSELKGAISSYGHTVRKVSAEIGVHHTTMSNYFNGSRVLPSTVLSDACEVIGVDPSELVDRAYRRLLAEMGPYDGGNSGVGLAPAPSTPTPDVDLSELPEIMAASDRNIDAEVEAWQQEP